MAEEWQAELRIQFESWVTLIFWGELVGIGRLVLAFLFSISSIIVQKIGNPLLIVLGDPSCHIDSLAV